MSSPVNNTLTATMGHFLEGFYPMFYLKTPSSSSFKEVSEVPNYIQQVIPYFMLLILLEAVVRWLQQKPLPRTNDSINSISNGIMEQLSHMLTGAFAVTSYAWVHHNFCVIHLPWNSAVVWWLAFFGVDFLYYLFHRMAHEIHLFWMAHQVHHSSEDYTLSTALRQSMFQRFTSWFFYLPLALVVPPSAYLVHKQLNLLYQFWIHTEVISHLGPLEWVLNTPSHHRVHHGRNPYCIDKNYAGMLIIWDRIFGTFTPESEKVIYGLVHPLNSWNPLWAQFHHIYYIISNTGLKKGFLNKLYFLLKGPGWSPGKPRLGSIEDIPQVSPDDKPYDYVIPRWLNIYCVIHFLLVLHWTTELGKANSTLPYFTVLGLVLFLIFSLTNFGLMFDCRAEVSMLEPLRLVIYLIVDVMLMTQNVDTGFPWAFLMLSRIVCGFSLTLWTSITIKYNLLYVNPKLKS